LVLTNAPSLALRDSAVANLLEPLVVVGIPAFDEEKTIARVILEAETHVRIVVVCTFSTAITLYALRKFVDKIVRRIRDESYF
jgi:hypothetical protein